MLTDKEYEREELKRHFAFVASIESAPIADRREAMKSWQAALKDVSLLRSRVEWLIEGCYGYGSCLLAARIIAQKRGNKVAAIGQLIAAVEWQCPASYAVKAWKVLTAKQREAANKAIERAMKTSPVITV